MHLLKFDDHDNLSLTSDLIDDLPPYAILSHTWGADTDEVTFRDLQDGTNRNKTGYNKLRFCGEQARRDGLRYFWVDTCCIDKSSHTELSEAINSMFRWYQESTKCYVYLSDVSKNMPDDVWDSAFRKSRWFTRGWTLQELIAPKSVEFFSNESKRLGDKGSLEQQIHEITSISKDALQGRPLSSFSISERLSWGENRETRRKEDKAYSLMGIFNIYMVPIYGEGNYAFTRLRDEINRRSPVAGPLYMPDVDYRRAIELQSQGNYFESEKLHRKVLAWREQVLETDHQDTLDSVCNLAYVLQRGRNDRTGVVGPHDDSGFYLYTRDIGGDGGGFFTEIVPTPGLLVKKIHVWATDYFITGLQMEYTNGQESRMRGSGEAQMHRCASYTFQLGESVKELNLWEFWDGQGIRLGRIRMNTSAGNVFEHGMITSHRKPHSQRRLGSGLLVGVHGRYGADIDKLGFVWLAPTMITRAPSGSTALRSQEEHHLQEEEYHYTRGAGGNSGGPFREVSPVPEHLVRTIHIWTNDHCITALQLEFANGKKSSKRGDGNANHASYTFEPGETVTEVVFWAGCQGTRFGRIKIATSLGGVFEHGVDDGTIARVRTDVGTGILAGVYGFAGSDIDWLGLVFLKSLAGDGLQQTKAGALMSE